MFRTFYKRIPNDIHGMKYPYISFEIKYGLNDDFPKQKPYFSITCTGKSPYGRFLYGGADHDKILEVRPDMKDLVDLHLSNINGEPMYAVENGWYFVTEKNLHSNLTEKDRPEIVSNYLRIPLKTAESIIKKYNDGKYTKDDFIKFIDKQRPRWKKEAKAVIDKYKLEVRTIDLKAEDKPKGKGKER